MGDPLKKGQEMGKAAAKPVAYYRRPADFPIALVPPVSPSNAPFYNVPGKGKTKRFCVIVGAPTPAESGVEFKIKRVRNGSPTEILSFTQGSWGANQTIEISTASEEVEDDDVLTMSISGLNAAKLLPEFLFFVVLDLGE